MATATLTIDVLTAFPWMFPGPVGESVSGRALDRGIAQLNALDLRQFTEDRHRTIDDEPYGGGGGMVLQPGPVVEGVRAIQKEAPDAPVVLLSPRGRPFDHATASELSRLSRFILVCGHYKGFDERIRTILEPREISLGDYVLSGGELAALVVIDAVLRLVPGTLGNFDSAESDSFYDGLLDGPIYTRPRTFEGERVPEALLSGDHERIRRWRLEGSLRTTLAHRPDLLDRRELEPEEEKLLADIQRERKRR